MSWCVVLWFVSCRAVYVLCGYGLLYEHAVCVIRLWFAGLFWCGDVVGVGLVLMRGDIV